MEFPRQILNQFIKPAFYLLIVCILSGCAVKLVADYDAAAFEDILRVGKKTDKFYGDLLETNANDRSYQKYASQYVDIETDIRSMVIRNRTRQINEESTQISAIILELWIKYKDIHKAKDAYSDGRAKLDRNRFARLFEAAASAERAKNLDADDKDLKKDSK